MKLPNDIVVIGAGGHAKVVIATVRAAGGDVAAAYDDDQRRWGESILGVEIRDALRDYVASRLARRRLVNARVMQADARRFMRYALEDASLQALHFYFPDPWWKKRHRKRRIWTEELFRDFERVLRPGGLLHLASDVEAVWESLVALADRQPGLVRAEDAVLPPLCTTNFEDKALRDGRVVGRTAYRRLGP